MTLQQSLNVVPKWLVYATGSIPGAVLFFKAFTDQLGADPVKALEHGLGLWSFRFLLIGLLITPLWRLGGPKLTRYRRAFGLLTFFYAVAHVTVYVTLDQGLDGAAIVADVLKRPYITAGMVAFIILVPLAVTSNNAMIRRLQHNWSKLHQWVYVTAIAAALHYILAVKSWPAEPVLYAVLVIILLSVRLFLNYFKRKSPAFVRSGL